MQRLEVSGGVRHIYMSLGFKRLKTSPKLMHANLMLYLVSKLVYSYKHKYRTFSPLDQ